MSLGVDLVPHKVCSLDCVYCEVGRTTQLTTERKEYVDADAVKEELTDYFSTARVPDYITFSGSGEPTLNSRIGDIIRFIKKFQPDIPVAVLTNGTLLSDPAVRGELYNADLVLPSLDAATEPFFKMINRPAPALGFNTYIRGLIEFSEKFSGIIWLEVFILPGYNDGEEELSELKKIILDIKPDSVQVNTLDRPGTLPGIRSAAPEELQRVLDFWQLENASVIASSAKRKGTGSYRADMEAAIMETIARRPCTPEDLSSILGSHISEINKYLDVLEGEKKIKPVRKARGVFYKIDYER